MNAIESLDDINLGDGIFGSAAEVVDNLKPTPLERITEDSTVPEVYDAIIEQGDITGSDGKKYHPEDVIITADTIMRGNENPNLRMLTSGGSLRPALEKVYKGNHYLEEMTMSREEAQRYINNAEGFGQLYNGILSQDYWENKEGKRYNPRKLIEDIGKVRREGVSSRYITRAAGIRKKVEELLEKRT